MILCLKFLAAIFGIIIALGIILIGGIAAVLWMMGDVKLPEADETL